MAIGFVKVRLVKAKGLQNTDIFGAIEAYAVVQYKSQEHRSSISNEKGSNPVWNKKFTFKVEYPGSVGEYKLILKIMDKDQLSADDLVGETIIHVEDLLALGVENGHMSFILASTEWSVQNKVIAEKLKLVSLSPSRKKRNLMNKRLEDGKKATITISFCSSWSTYDQIVATSSFKTLALQFVLLCSSVC